MKILLEGLKGRFGQAEEQINELEDRTITIKSVVQKEKVLKKNYLRLKDL